MDEILKYLEEQYALSTADLALPDDERNFLMGQLSMIAEVRDLVEHGLPTEEKDVKDD